jgi:hypothetical protein
MSSNEQNVEKKKPERLCFRRTSRSPIENADIWSIPCGFPADDELLKIQVEAIVRDAGRAKRPNSLIRHPAEVSLGNVNQVRAHRAPALAEVCHMVACVIAHDKSVKVRVGIVPVTATLVA